MPKRKKSDDKPTSTPAGPSSSADDASTGKAADSTRQAYNTSLDRDKAPQNRWSGGSWRGKASAVAEIARESISASNASAQSTPAQRLSRSLRTPTKSLPSAAMTRLNISSNASEEASSSSKEPKPNDNAVDTIGNEDSDDNAAAQANEKSLKERPVPAAGWRGWWTKASDASDEKSGEESDSTLHAEELNEQSKASADKGKSADPKRPEVVENKDKKHSEDNEEPVAIPARSSWFGLWGSGQPVSAESSAAQKSKPVDPSVSSEPPKDTEQDPKQTAKPQEQITTLPQSSSSWAFWSRGNPDRLSKIATDGDHGKEVGEIAVADSPSQTKPQPAKLSEHSRKKGDETPPSKKRGRADVVEASGSATKKASVERNEALMQNARSSEPSSGSEGNDMTQSVLRTTVEKSGPKSVKAQANLVLPGFKSTYHLAETPSYWQQLSKILGRTAGQETKHVALAPTPHKPQKAIAIGIHGYFPAALIQRAYGTSLRFANGAASAIQKWANAHDVQCDIEKVALEGEGMIFDRVDTLWSLLLNWIDHIRKADFIMVACHSQGVPVAIMIVARLLDFGVISPSARLGVCGMAGVNLGPFPSYQTRFLGSSAAELFAFSQPASAVSQRYLSSLSRCLSSHVRILYVGSIDDQLVSLESAIFAPLKHPYIYRAVFVDGRIHAPDFLTHLVGFALKLRNLGIPDHGLLRELSGPLAGSLYTGEGHSRIYEEDAVYDLAVQHTLETTSIHGSYATLDLELLQRAAAEAVAGSNPYYLPWAMRGLLEEEFVKTELQDETKELLRLFESWKPTSKVLKDVKFRLEAVKSKL